MFIEKYEFSTHFFQNRPILVIFILAAILSFPLYLLTHVNNRRLQIIISLTFLALAFFYFGLLPTAFLIILLLAILSFSQKFSLSLIVVFFSPFKPTLSSA